MSFQSKDDKVLSVQLKVQEVCVKLSDNQVVSISGSTAIIQLGETIAKIVAAIHVDDSVGVSIVAVANQAVSGTQVTLTLAAPLAANDAILLKYVVAE